MAKVPRWYVVVLCRLLWQITDRSHSTTCQTAEILEQPDLEACGREKRVSSPTQFRNKNPHLPHERTLARGRGRPRKRILRKGSGGPSLLLLVRGWLEPPPPHQLLLEPPVAVFQHKGPCGFSFLLSLHCLLPTLPFQELSEAKAHGCQQTNTTHESGFQLRVYCGQWLFASVRPDPWPYMTDC